jgi:sec-independent protein translocase protein TatA
MESARNLMGSCVMGEFSWVHLVIVLGIALVIFGPKKLPEMGRSLGKGIREFKQATAGLGEELRGEVSEQPASAAPTVSVAEAASIPATVTEPAPVIVDAQGNVYELSAGGEASPASSSADVAALAEPSPTDVAPVAEPSLTDGSESLSS